jgi:hypothetical protein
MSPWLHFCVTERRHAADVVGIAVCSYEEQIPLMQRQTRLLGLPDRNRLDVVDAEGP